MCCCFLLFNVMNINLQKKNVFICGNKTIFSGGGGTPVLGVGERSPLKKGTMHKIEWLNNCYSFPCITSFHFSWPTKHWWTTFRLDGHSFGASNLSHVCVFRCGSSLAILSCPQKKGRPKLPHKMSPLCEGEGAARNGAGDYARHMMHV